MKTLSQFLSESSGTSNLASQLFFNVRAAATFEHFHHLTTNSFSVHSALDTFYTDIIDILDEFIESYQSKYGKISNIPQLDSEYTIYKLRDWLKLNKLNICSDSELQNILDELLGLLDRTIYKLENLK